MGHRISLHYVPEESRVLAAVRTIALAVAAAYLVIGAISAYRAYFQVWRVTLEVPGAAAAVATTLSAGSPVRVGVLTSGRVPVDVRLELVQGARAETIGTTRVWKNHDGVIDPRPGRGAIAATLSPALLAGFDAGPAMLRATALGRSQWLRVPPPTVRQLAVRIAPPPPAPASR